MAKRYNSTNIETLLSETFTDEKIRCFCYDVADFNSVYEVLTQNTSKTDVIKLVIAKAHQNSQLETLLLLVQEYDPIEYEKYQPYYEFIDDNQLSNNLQTTKSAVNPFIPGVIATNDKFIGRQTHLQHILEHIYKGISTAIVGNPHIGKSSLLHRLLELQTIAEGPLNPGQYTLIDRDCHLFFDLTPITFWQELLNSIITDNPQLAPIFDPVLAQGQFNSIELGNAFRRLTQQNHRVILLIDEFDVLLRLPAFGTPNFLGTLRSITHKDGRLVLITASRESVAEMNAHLDNSYKNLSGSSLLNYLQSLPLGNLSSDETTSWLSRYFETPEIIQGIVTLSGRHPYLLQIAGELVFEAQMQGFINFSQIYPIFVDRAQEQFRDVWKSLNGKAQIALVIFALDYVNRQTNSREEISLTEAKQRLVWYESEIKNMAQRGTLEMAPNGQYKIGSLAFLGWIVDTKIVALRGSEPQEVFVQWLIDKEYKLDGLVTQEEIMWLQKVWQNIPDRFIKLVRKTILPRD